MADPANVRLLDEFLRHQVYLERVKRGEVDLLAAFLTRLTDDVSAQLGRTGELPLGTGRAAQLQQLLRDVGRLSDEAADAMAELSRGQLRDLAAYEGGYTLSALRAVLPVQVALEGLAPQLLWTAAVERPFEGRPLEQWFGDYKLSQRQRLQAAVRLSVTEGETVDQAIRRVRGTRAAGFRDGVVPGLQKRAAEALARTAINHVVTTAREATYQTNAVVVDGVTWRSTLDGRTTLICIARDGKVYELGVGPRPPAHPNCRSTTVPVLKSWKALGINLPEAPPGTRASLDGQVPATETYGTWLRRQPASFQDDVLGATRGRLFRQGGLTVDRFVDEQLGRGYSLTELRRRHPTAFAQAGL